PATGTQTNPPALPPSNPASQVAPQRGGARTVTLPAGAPAWLKENVEWMSSVDLGCHFTAVLEGLVGAETAFGFDESTYSVLAAEGRPAEVHKWIKSGCAARSQAVPKIKNVLKFEEEWGQWWSALQPTWHERNADGSWRAGGDATYGADDKWGKLDTPGPNGCLSLVAGLFLWGASEKTEA
ncbi:hypothetical protein C8R46DRAFT_903128, partial [Mycena filopes]